MRKMPDTWRSTPSPVRALSIARDSKCFNLHHYILYQGPLQLRHALGSTCGCEQDVNGQAYTMEALYQKLDVVYSIFIKILKTICHIHFRPFPSLPTPILLQYRKYPSNPEICPRKCVRMFTAIKGYDIRCAKDMSTPNFASICSRREEQWETMKTPNK